MKNLFTRKEVIEIIDDLISRPKLLKDAVFNKKTEHNAETLLLESMDVISGCIVTEIDFEKDLFKLINVNAEQGLSKDKTVKKLKYVLKSVELS